MGFMDELKKLTQPYDDEDDFFEDMESQRIEEVTNVPHFCMWKNTNQEEMGFVYAERKTNKKLFAEFEEFSKPEARIFELLLYDELYKLIN